MGLTQSSRKITITNNDTRPFAVSNTLAERLSQGMVDDSVAAAHNQDAQRVLSVPASSVRPNLPVHRKILYTQDQPNLTLSALQMQQDKQDELQDTESYWQNRLQTMEDNHNAIDQIFETEYKKAFDEISNKKGVEIDNAVTPCLESSKQVLQCYLDHPREILKCADLLEQFTNCVDRRRAQLIEAR